MYHGFGRGEQRPGVNGNRKLHTFGWPGGMDDDDSAFLDSGYFDTRRTARYLDLSPRTLDGYRVSGDGPAVTAVHGGPTPFSGPHGDDRYDIVYWQAPDTCPTLLSGCTITTPGP